MTIARALLLLLCAAGAAQGRPASPTCAGDRECKDGRKCVRTADGARRCELVCNPDKPACPEDQRCIKDGPSHVCKPINDSAMPGLDW
jgi:hypothetical protein